MMENHKVDRPFLCPKGCSPVDDRCIEMWDSLRQDQDALDVVISAKGPQYMNHDGSPMIDEGGVPMMMSNRTVCANSRVLSAASPVLKAMLMGDFAEGGTKTISIDESIEQESLDLLIELLYCGSACDDERDSRSHQNFLDVLSLAHRWQVSYVCDLCTRRLAAAVDAENAESIAAVATQLGCTDLEEAIRKFARMNDDINQQIKEGTLGPALQMLLSLAESSGQPKAKKRRCDW